MKVVRVVAVAGLAAFATCGGAPTVTLRYRPPAGQTLEYVMDQDVTIRIESSPRRAAERQDMRMHFEVAQRVKGPVANGTEISVRINRADVDFPQLPPEARSLAARMLQGLEMRTVYDDRMRLLSAEMVSQGRSVELTNQITGGLLGGAFPLPERPVRAGQSWEGEIASPMGEMPGVDKPMKVQYKIRLARIRQSITDTVARFDVEVSFPTDPIPIAEGGGTGTLTMAGSLKGDMEYSITRSALLHTSLNGSVRMTSDKPGSEGTIVVDLRLDVLLLDTGTKP